MITDISKYTGPHGSVRHKLRGIRQELDGLRKRELRSSQHDTPEAQALAKARADTYAQLVRLTRHIEEGITDVEKHVKAHPHGPAAGGDPVARG